MTSAGLHATQTARVALPGHRNLPPTRTQPQTNWWRSLSTRPGAATDSASSGSGTTRSGCKGPGIYSSLEISAVIAKAKRGRSMARWAEDGPQLTRERVRDGLKRTRTCARDGVLCEYETLSERLWLSRFIRVIRVTSMGIRPGLISRRLVFQRPQTATRFMMPREIKLQVKWDAVGGADSGSIGSPR